MKSYSVMQAFFIAPSEDNPSVNSGLDTWTFATEEEAVAQFKQLIEDLKADPDYQAGQLDGSLEIVHTHGENSNHTYQIDVSKNGKPYEVIYVEVVTTDATGEMTWWSKQRDRHQKRVADHFLTQEQPQYVVTQTAVADDASENLVASSIITWTFGRLDHAKALMELLKTALQEDYHPMDAGGVKIVHFTDLDSDLDYRIEVSENGAPTEVIMVELHTIQPSLGGETWWSEHRHHHQEAVTKRFFNK
ncbi:MAG: hypothetical protein ACRCWD_06735 [Culicoidibacterales bacterium]